LAFFLVLDFALFTFATLVFAFFLFRDYYFVIIIISEDLYPIFKYFTTFSIYSSFSLEVYFSLKSRATFDCLYTILHISITRQTSSGNTNATIEVYLSVFTIPLSCTKFTITIFSKHVYIEINSTWIKLYICISFLWHECTYTSDYLSNIPVIASRFNQKRIIYLNGKTHDFY